LIVLNRPKNWSNAAFNAGTGYANLDGQRGCIDGGNFR